MRYLLFTECLQNDFVAPMTAGAPLPNELHIGRAESRRLLGDPEGPWAEEGPLARFLRAFRAGAGPEHASIHIRDWHDPAGPGDARAPRALRRATACAARPAPSSSAPLAPVVSAGGIVVDSAVLSDFVGTTLEETLAAAARRRRCGPGIIGVWTDFKVQYLAYELQTRLGRRATSRCAGRSRPRAAASRTARRSSTWPRTSGVTVIDSIPEFLGLAGDRGGRALRPLPKGRPRPALELPEGTSLDDEERRLVEHLYRECRSVRLVPDRRRLLRLARLRLVPGRPAWAGARCRS